jgi:hypothetical protein
VDIAKGTWNMSFDPSLVLVGLALALALVSLGGGVYEVSVVDPAWPGRFDLIQPDRGGISRKRFWIPAHTAFELVLLVALVVAWDAADVRLWLLVSLAAHAVMRIWSAFDFIPKALAFERASGGTLTEDAARRWTRRSRLRLPLDILSCVALLAAFAQASRLGP